MTNKRFIEYLKSVNACDDAIAWVGKRDFKQVWEECDRGDWLLWLAAKLKIDHRKLTLAKARCAETVLHLMEDERSKEAVRVAISYGEGIATEEELRTAANAAYAAYAADTANAAAYAAANAADTANAAAYAAYAAAYAAYAAAAYAAAAYAASAAAAYAAAANAAAYADARSSHLKLCADIVREVIDFEIIENKLNKLK